MDIKYFGYTRPHRPLASLETHMIRFIEMDALLAAVADDRGSMKYELAREICECEREIEFRVIEES